MKTRNIRNGFTMIELIFVIVILGLLAAVAIPKLSATRTDAEITKMSANLSTVISDIGSHYTAYGSLDKWKDATNVPLETAEDTLVSSDTEVTTATYLYKDDKQCLKFISTKDGNLTISNGSDTSDDVCKTVQSINLSKISSHVFGGSRVKY